MSTATLSPSALAEITDRLVQCRLEATRRATCLFDEAMEAIEPLPDGADPGEAPPQPARVQQLAALAHEAARAVREADDALCRISEGTYGMCLRCGTPMSPERLLAHPESSTCPGCDHEEPSGPS